MRIKSLMILVLSISIGIANAKNCNVDGSGTYNAVTQADVDALINEVVGVISVCSNNDCDYNGDLATNVGDVSYLLDIMSGIRTNTICTEPVVAPATYVFSHNIGGPGTGNLQFDAPQGLTVIGNHLFIADSGNGRVQEIDENDQWVRNIGPVLGGGESMFGTSSICYNGSNRIVVTEYANNSLSVFDQNFVFQYKITSFNNGDIFGLPRGCYFSPSGELFIVDDDDSAITNTHHRIIAFDNQLSYMRSYGSKGSNNGQLLNPQDTYVDNQGNLTITERGNNRIQKLDSSGNFVTAWNGLYNTTNTIVSPRRIMLGSDNNYYVSSDNGFITIYSPTGLAIGQVGESGANANQMARPIGIAFFNNKLYVVDNSKHRISVFTK